MTVSLYSSSGSPPCRTVELVAAALNLDLNVVEMKPGGNLTPDFIQKNPQHTIPTIVDGDLTLWESRTIARYLVNKYAPGSPLYPADPNMRALVDQRLDFDLGTLYPRFSAYFYPTLFGNAKPDEALLKKLEEGLGFLNSFLEGRKYAAGDQLTIADLSLVATVSTIDAVGMSLEPYSNILRWYDLVKKTAPSYKEVIEKGLDAFKQMINRLKEAKNEN